MSPYRLMRDPAENKDIVPGYVGDPENAEDAWADTLHRIKAMRDAMRVLSFTGDATGGVDTFDCCWARPRMWEQYGDVHRGACLVFDSDRLVASLVPDLHRQGLNYVEPVEYTREGIVGHAADMTLDESIVNDATRARALAGYIERHHKAFFFLKSEDFATEHEFRAVLMQPDDEYAYVSYGDALVAVIVGERFPDWQIPGVRAACEAVEVETRRMYWWQGEPFARSL